MDKVYFQKMIYSGTSYKKGDVKETVKDFSVYIQEVPFILLSDMKDVAKRDWHDEDGIDVFYNNSNPPAKDYDIEITCEAKSDDVSVLRDKVDAFIKYITGGDGKGCVFAIYDTHCQAGRYNVRFTKVSQKTWFNMDSDDTKILVFQITMHVDSPRSSVSLVMDKSGEVTDLIIVQ